MNRERTSWILIGGFLLICAIVIGVVTRESKPTAAKPAAHWQPKLPPHAQTVPQTLLPPIAVDRATPLEHYVSIESSVDLALLDSVLTDTPLKDQDYETFAGILSYEYRAAAGPFAKQKIFAPLKRAMQKKLEAFKNNRYFSITQPFYLEHYDLKTQSFPLTPSMGSTVTWLYNGRIPYIAKVDTYILTLSNAQDFAHYPVQDQTTAKAMEARAVTQRAGQGRVYLFAQDAGLASHVAYITDHAIRAEIVKVQLFDAKSQLIGEVSSPNKNSNISSEQ